MKIFVGNLSREATENDLRELFEPFGELRSVEVIKDRYTGESRGFAFIEMPTEDQAKKAIQGLNQKELRGRKLTVNEARPKEQGGGGGGGGEGRGGRSGGRGGRW